MSKKASLIYPLFLLLLFVFFNKVSAQKESMRYIRTKVAVENIEKLKEGVLIVALPSQDKKLKAMETLLQSDDLSDKSRKTLQKRYDLTKEETISQNRQIIKSFKNHFTLSNLLFTYDSHLHLLNGGNPGNIFLNEKLAHQKDISISETNYFILKFGFIGEAQMDAIAIYDAQRTLLQSPFPAAARTNTFAYFLDRIFSPKKAFEENIKRSVKKLDRKLVQFYQKYVN